MSEPIFIIDCRDLIWWVRAFELAVKDFSDQHRCQIYMRTHQNTRKRVLDSIYSIELHKITQNKKEIVHGSSMPIMESKISTNEDSNEDIQQFGVIYKITSPSGRVYIGQTRNFQSRMSAYRRYASVSDEDAKKLKQPKIVNSLRKYGFEKHSVEILLRCGVDDLSMYERKFIALYDSNSTNGLNCTDGGEGIVNCEQQKIAVRKSNVRRTGETRSTETRRLISEAAKKRDPSSRLHSIESKRKIGEANRKRKGVFQHSEEGKQNISKGMVGVRKGEVRSKAQRQKQSKVMKGRKLSEATKAKMRAAHARNRELRNKNPEAQRAYSQMKANSARGKRLNDEQLLSFNKTMIELKRQAGDEVSKWYGMTLEQRRNITSTQINEKSKKRHC